MCGCFSEQRTKSFDMKTGYQVVDDHQHQNEEQQLSKKTFFLFSQKSSIIDV